MENSDCDIQTIEHIQHCVSCKLKAEQYNILFREIQQQEKPVFDFNLSELVLTQIAEPTPRNPLVLNMFYLLVIAGLILFGIVFYLFRISILSIFTSSSVWIIAIVFLTATLISLFQGFEFYKKYQQKMEALNFH